MDPYSSEMAAKILVLLALTHAWLGLIMGVQTAVTLNGPILLETHDNSMLLPADKQVLSRKKRYVSFPTGSVFNIIICLAKRTLIRYPDFYTFNFDLDVGYRLPNNTQFFLNRKKRDVEGTLDEDAEASVILHRRERRVLYSQAEEFLEALGLDGRECVLRTICEANQVLPPGGQLMEDMFRAIFTMPPMRLGQEEEFTGTDGNGFNLDPKDERTRAKEYDAANSLGRENVDCSRVFPSCTVSLLEVALW